MSGFAAFAVLILLSASAGWAATLDIDLFTSNLGSGFPGDYAHVHADYTTNTAHFTFTSLTSGGFLYLFGDGGSAALNVASSAAFTVADVTGIRQFGGTALTLAGGDFAVGAPGTEDGFGSYNLTINSTGQADQDAANKIDISLTTTGTWNGLLGKPIVVNDHGFWAAAHIFACTAPCSTADFQAAANTGFAAGAAQVSEAGILSVMGFGLVGVGTVLRRFRSRRYSPSAA